MESKSQKFRVSFIAIFILITLSVIMLLPGMIFAADESVDTATTETVDIKETIEFDVTYPEVRAKAGSTFDFNAVLSYEGDKDQTFELSAAGPEGWYVSVQPASTAKEISAVKMEPGTTETLKISAVALVEQGPGEYDITLTAKNEDLKLEAETTFKAIVTATYDFTFTSKTGMLNTKATSGKNNPFIVVLTSTGSADIENISFTADAPSKWVVKFEPEKIETLTAGETKEVTVTITPPEKTIAGDYMLTIISKSDNAEQTMDVRVTVETPSIWGWVGIGVIVIVVIGVAIIFAKLGRR